MVNKMYSVYDCKAEAYMTPFFMRSRGEVLRAWVQVVNEKETQFCKHPSDFTLFEIGEFDDSKGVVTMYDTKVSLGVAVEFVRGSGAVDPVSLVSSN